MKLIDQIYGIDKYSYAVDLYVCTAVVQTGIGEEYHIKSVDENNNYYRVKNNGDRTFSAKYGETFYLLFHDAEKQSKQSKEKKCNT